jgi:hypothetical protein
MSAVISTADRAAATKEKGGTPGSGRQGKTNMDIMAKAGAGNVPDPSATNYRVNSPDRNASLWLDDQIDRSQDSVTTQIVELTPALARVLLARNPDNRKLSEPTIAKYARDIANGSWSFNGEPIIIAKDGKMNDGQHRCEAVIAAGASIIVVMVVGTDRQTRFTVDQGRARMAGDYLAMEGHVDSVGLAAVAGYVWQHREHGRLSQQMLHRPTKGEILAVVDGNPDIAKSLALIPRAGNNLAGGRGILGFCHFAFSRRANAADVAEFFSMLVNGQNLSAKNPILYARNRLMANRGRLKPNEKAELIFRAWNAHRRRETPKTLAILDGPLPIVER